MNTDDTTVTKILPGGGEMGERIRAFNWSETPIGPIESWSPALRMMTSFLLANRFPLLLWWGPKFIQIYNDPYRPVLGTKHPSPGLGRPGSECWSEIWDILRPLVETPFNGGPATWMDDIFLEVNRFGFVEETHFTIAYSPVPDESVPGGIGGVLATVHEITEKVVGERRLGLLRDLGAHSTEAKSAEEACAVAAVTLSHAKDVPFALLYLIDPNQRQARLAAVSGIAIGSDASPTVIDLAPDSPSAAWPLAQVLGTEQLEVVENLSDRFQNVPRGPWSDPPHSGAVVPIHSNIAHQLAGFLVIGLSPRLRFDEQYRNFLELMSTQIATAIANARAYEEERKRSDQLAELDRAKTAFFSNVSHEFRTPLTLMLGPLEELLGFSEGVLPAEVTASLAVAHRNGRRLLKLVNTLLDFSRIEAGRIDAHYEPTDLAAFTADLASVFRSVVEKAGLRLTVNCPRLPEPVFVDREMWEKVVLNLLSNAFKFTFEGEIEVSLHWCGERVELCVSDTGVGIPQPELSKVFERFHRVRGAKSRTHEGTGIGLALVQELAHLHGGEVKVQSREGEGSKFIVSIQTGKTHLPPERIHSPRQGVASPAATSFVEEALRWLPDEAEKGVADALISAPRTSTARARILLADDNADMREYVKRLLAQRFEVEAVADGEAALESIVARRPDLVLTDVMMPRLDGFGLLRKLRDDERTRTIPVIMLSARAGEEARVEGLNAGADDYLIKPFSARELMARVQSQLELARVRQQSEQALRYRSEQFETLLNQAPLGMYLIDADFRIAQVNPSALPVFDNIPGPLIGRDFDEIIHWLWEKNHADEMVRIFRHTLRTGESYYTPERAEFRIDLGITEYYEWRLDRITLPDGRHGLVCYFRDISQQVVARKGIEESREALRASEEQLEQTVKERTAKLIETVGELEAFSYSIAHDMRAPLRSLQGFSAILLEEYSSKIDEHGQAHLRRISASADRMDRLIHDILNYSRIVRTELPLRPVNVDQLLEGILETYPAFFQPRVDIQVQSPLPKVLGNEAALTQCLSNLLGNAVKFVVPGSKPKVRVSGEQRNGHVRLSVQDNGIGIPLDQHERIFAIFQRLNKNFEGTGIGLAIAKKAVERMGGKIGLDSLPGKGSTFWIELQAA